MSKLKYLSLFSGLLLFIVSCSPFNVVSDYDRNTNFSQYRTFSINTNELGLNDIDKSRVTSELANQLAIKGFHLNESSDIIIYIKANHQTVTNQYVTPSVNLGGWGRGFGWGLGLGRIFSNQYNVGTLIFDFIDAKTGKLVWQGKGKGIRVDSPQSKQQQIPQLISEMLKNYPPTK